MAFYTSGLKTHIVDPVHDSKNFQTEFRFKSGTVFLSNLRLLNVGIQSSTTNLQDSQYNHLAGAAACIQSIHLYDGNVLLDQILEFPIWAAFSAYNQSNQVNKDMNQMLAKNKLGFAAVAGNRSLVGKYPGIIPAYNGIASTIADNEPATKKSWISLKAILPMLDNSVYLPTSIYKNLRLVVQYNTKANQIGVNQALTGPETFKTCECTLIADEITDPKKAASITNQYKGVNFLAIEHDKVYVPPITAPPVAGLLEQPQNFVPSGFDNKTVNRLLIVNTPSAVTNAPTLYEYSSLGSLSQVNQKIQVRVNGANIFPKNGVTRPNERLAYLTDAWGTCNAHLGSNLPCYTNVNVKAPVENKVMSLNMVGTLDYFGCSIGQTIQELQIDYSRSKDKVAVATDDNRQGQQLYLNLFAETNKVIQVKGGRVTVSYL